jgi:hypothetical protein
MRLCLLPQHLNFEGLLNFLLEVHLNLLYSGFFLLYDSLELLFLHLFFFKPCIKKTLFSFEGLFVFKELLNNLVFLPLHLLKPLVVSLSNKHHLRGGRSQLEIFEVPVKQIVLQLLRSVRLQSSAGIGQFSWSQLLRNHELLIKMATIIVVMLDLPRGCNTR